MTYIAWGFLAIIPLIGASIIIDNRLHRTTCPRFDAPSHVRIIVPPYDQDAA